MSENGGWRWGEVVIGSMRLAGKGKALLYDLNALFGFIRTTLGQARVCNNPLLSIHDFQIMKKPLLAWLIVEAVSSAKRAVLSGLSWLSELHRCYHLLYKKELLTVNLQA